MVDKYNIYRVVFGGDFVGPVGDNISTQCLDAMCEFIETIQNKCIESILCNDYQNFKIFIVDNNSSDDSMKKTLRILC